MYCELLSFRRSSNFQLLTLDSNAANAFNFSNQCITDASNKSCIWNLSHIEKERKLITLQGRIIRLIRKNVLRDTQNSIRWQILPFSRWQKKWTIESNKTSLFFVLHFLNYEANFTWYDDSKCPYKPIRAPLGEQPDDRWINNYTVVGAYVAILATFCPFEFSRGYLMFITFLSCLKAEGDLKQFILVTIKYIYSTGKCPLGRTGGFSANSSSVFFILVFDTCKLFLKIRANRTNVTKYTYAL